MPDRRNNKPQPDSAAPGHVVVDSRGRNVWQWDGADTDSTTSMLRSLDNPDLALEPTRQVRRPKAADIESGSPQRRAAAAAGRADPGAHGGPARGQSAGRRTQLSGRAGGEADRSKLRTDGTGRSKIGGGFDPYNRS